MIDLSFLNNFTHGDKNKMSKYICMYLKNAPGIFESMKNDIRTRDWESLAINAHSLKPQAEFMGIANLKEGLQEIEDNARKNITQNIDKIYNKTFDMHSEAINLLEEKLTQLSP